MSEIRLTMPEPVDLIPADEAASLIDVTQLELEELRGQAAEARAAAEALEAQVVREGVDERASTWVMVRLQRFLDSLRAEAEDEAQNLVDAARRGARARAHDSRAIEAFIRREPTPVSGVAPDPQAEGPIIAATMRPLVEAEPVATWEPLTGAAVAPPQPQPAAVMRLAPIVPGPPGANGVAAPSPVAAQHVAATQPPLEPVPPVAAAEPVAASEAIQQPAAPTAPPVARTATTVTAPKKRTKRYLGSLSVSVVLEIAALILVVVFIVLRLS